MKNFMAKVVIGADHAGFSLKEEVKKLLISKKITVEDMGAFSKSDKDDYPDFAFKVAEKVSKDKEFKGILICGTGSGMAMAANKVKGVRAVFAYDSYSVKMSKLHNDSNVLCLRGRNFSFVKAKRLVWLWLATCFEREKRHIRRIKKIEDYEKK